MIILIDLEKASNILEIPKESNDIHIFSAYKEKIETTLDRQLLRDLTEAKNLLIRKEVECQISSRNFFRLRTPPDFNICNVCKGSGEIYRFELIIIELINECSKCKGTGNLLRVCKKCNGTGSHYGKVCFNCKGTGFYVTNQKCTNCQGTGDIKTKRMTRTGKIAAVSTCKICRGTGLKKVQKKIMFCPVISKNIAELIKHQLKLK